MRLYFFYTFLSVCILQVFTKNSVLAFGFTSSRKLNHNSAYERLPEKKVISNGLLNAWRKQAWFKNDDLRHFGTSKELNLAKKPPRGRKYDFRYVEIGIGPAVWQTSHEPLMENQRNAIHFFVEYGDMLKPLSYVAGINFNPAFLQEGYLLETDYYFFNLKYSPSRKWYNWPIWMNIYGLLGASYWQASLTNTNFGNIGGSELLTETDNGLGFMTGAGISFEFFNFSLITQFTYELGVGQYLAGAFQPQNVHTGSAQVNIMLSYRFFMSGLQWRCPTYK